MDNHFEHNRGRRGGKDGRDRRDSGARRPYRFALFTDPEGGYILRSPDLPGRSVEVDSLQEVGTAVQSAVDLRIAELTAEAEQDDGLYSGKFVLRLPRTLHRQLAELAVEEGVSLNQLALTFLAEGMGRVDAAQELDDRRIEPRGPRGGHRPHGRRGRHGHREGDSPGRRGFGPFGHGPGGRDDREDVSPDERFGARGFGPGKGDRRGRRHPGVPGSSAGADGRPEAPADPAGPRLV